MLFTPQSILGQLRHLMAHPMNEALTEKRNDSTLTENDEEFSSALAF